MYSILMEYSIFMGYSLCMECSIFMEPSSFINKYENHFIFNINIYNCYKTHLPNKHTDCSNRSIIKIFVDLHMYRNSYIISRVRTS